jgi:outer membrane beta-barrel protein
MKDATPTSKTMRVRDGGAGCLPRAIRGLACAAALFTGVVAGVLAHSNTAQAQEILLTGPLKGEPSVRQLRLYRRGRFEIAPSVTFTLLDEYLRQTIVGARLNYNLTDYLAIGFWGGLSPDPLQFETGLVGRIQNVNDARARTNTGVQPDVRDRLTSLNLGRDFGAQLGRIDWVASPQVTFVPFRGKIALFQSLYLDTDLYVFAGPAIVSVTERAECAGTGSVSTGGCNTELPSAANPAIVVTNAVNLPTESRVTVAPTFGLGFSFYANRWAALGFEWRAVPFSRNTGGFDSHGGGLDNDFPDESVDSDDRDLKLNQMLTVSFNIHFPLDYKVSE